MRYFLLLASLYLGLASSLAWATVSINLSGSAQKSSANLETTSRNTVSANIGLNLGQYVSIGLTHRRSYEDTLGQKKATNAARTEYVYLPFQDVTDSTTNSIDLTLIPYSGIVSPFIFGGVAHRTYYNRYDYNAYRVESKLAVWPVPNYGFGIAIQLGGGFQLKVTQTFTPGKETTIDEDKVEHERKVLDRYAEIWLGYKI